MNPPDHLHIEDDPELPSYQDSQNALRVERSSAPLPTKHESALYDSANRKWLILRTNTRPRRNPEALPIFREGDIISGEVEADLNKDKTMKRISISVIGGTTLVGEDEFIILEETQILWTREGRGSKLVGRHVWPFRFTLPKQVQVKRCGTGKHNLPPTFAENGRTVYIDYRLLVDVKRGDFLRLDKTLATTFGYEIDSVSEPLSELRQLAYTEEIPLFGPGEDPYGWKVFPALTVKGTLSGKAVEVEITLAISNPTTYAIGYPIPLRISLTSKDTQALEELAKPTGVGLELVRSMASGIDAFDDNSFEKADDHFFDSAGFAFWWSTPQADPDPNQAAPNTKELRGELDVPRKIKPTFLFPRCSVRYTLELLPLSAPGWVNKSDTQNPLLSERVTIVSRQAPGMNVRSDAPPDYDRSQAVNYLQSMGLLENGNQRFANRRR